MHQDLELGLVVRDHIEMTRPGQGVLHLLPLVLGIEQFLPIEMTRPSQGALHSGAGLLGLWS